jgi:hypothetical protein
VSRSSLAECDHHFESGVAKNLTTETDADTAPGQIVKWGFSNSARSRV